MSLSLKKRNGEMSELFSDWVTPGSLFGPVFSELENRLPGRMGITMPSANIKETEKEIAIELAAPGLNSKDFKVELDGNVLTISTEIENEKEEEKGLYAKKEYAYNSFSRSFLLPENAVGDKIKATYANGILLMSIPKKDEAKFSSKKKITVS